MIRSGMISSLKEQSMLISLWLSLPRIKWIDDLIILRYVKKHNPKLYREFKDKGLVR